MKKKMYYLSTCSTCQRIQGELGSLLDGVELHEIKGNPMTEEQLEEMRLLAGSYEALFSKRAMKYRQLGLHEQTLSEADMKTWILKEYTFLKRPVTLVGDTIFVGSAKKEVAALRQALEKAGV
ncbi:MAG: arsenate reductase [Leptolyngbya sp. SIO3F4]|nr:arsenate reductase [Leptolyngbya sp. SIO3F4]